MAVRIRLTRVGATKRPSYRVVAIERRRARDGRALEILGFYDPLTDPATVNLETDRIKAWIGKGAQPSETVVKLMRQAEKAAAAPPPPTAKPAPTTAKPARATTAATRPKATRKPRAASGEPRTPKSAPAAAAARTEAAAAPAAPEAPGATSAPAGAAEPESPEPDITKAEA